MESAAQSLVGNVGQLLGEEYQLLRGVGGEVTELRDDLATMTALLRMQSEAGDGAVDHFNREWMKQLRELAYDTEDSVLRYKLRIKCPPGGDVCARLKHLFMTLFKRHRLASEIRALRARSIAISERHARYGIDREALRRSPYLSAPPMLAASASAQALRRENDPGADHQKLVGVDKQASILVGRLKAKAEGDKKLKVFSIFGFGGLGKTTLAMEVCRQLEAEFPYQAMMSVSQAFEPGRDLRALLKRVLEQVVKDHRGITEKDTVQAGIDGLDNELLADKLNKCLENKRYLIVIDDVWTIQAWEAILPKLPDNNCSSRIIMTTRIEAVAKACSFASITGQYIHQMQRLTPEDSKELFVSRTFGNRDCPDELEAVMCNIIKRCGGMPLAIISIASVLTGYTSPGSKDKWETIYKSIGSQMESNPTLEGMRQIVTLSYNHLPHELKACMMYLSLFPEDYEIDKYRLLCRWIAEGLVQEKRGLTLMEVAESYLDELVSRSMIELRVSLTDYWKRESCLVHDILLEVMVCKALESNFVSLQGAGYAVMPCDRIRRLCIHGGKDMMPKSVEQHKKKTADQGIEGIDVEHVRSLSMFQHNGQNLLNQLDKFTLLMVLDLEGSEELRNHHMRYICRLYLLKFLSLRGTNISFVPPEIGNLEHLQTFDVRGAPVRGLPQAVTKLHKLERLQICDNGYHSHMWRLPRGLKKMKALRELGFTILRNDVEVAEELGELEQLQELAVYIDNRNIYDNVRQAVTNSLVKLYSLRRLVIEGVVEDKESLKFLNDLSTPLQLLRFLMFRGSIGGLPKWVGSLRYLVQFNMSWGRLSGDQLFDSLCELPSLKIIGIGHMCYVDRELVARTKHRFPELTYLRVACNNETPNILRFEKGTMPKVETLLFNFKHHDKGIIGIEHLTSLKEVQLWGMKDNNSLDSTLEQLMDENMRRQRESINHPSSGGGVAGAPLCSTLFAPPPPPPPQRLMSRRLLPRITPPHRRRNPKPLITPAVAASLAHVLATRATNPAWPRALAALLPAPLSDARLAAAVSSLADPDLALVLLSWSQTHHHHHDSLRGPAATPLAHSALLRVLARAGRFDAVDATLQSMSRAGDGAAAAPTRACLGALAAAYADAGMDGKAAEMCARARELYGALPATAHCNRLLRLLVERRRWEDARKLYDEMLAEEGGGADNYSTCVMVRGLCLEGRVEEGRKLVEARWGVGCIPHVVFYNVLIDGYCRRGDIRRGLLLLGDMETKGFLPTTVTYGVIINWLGRKGDLEKIASTLDEMRVRGLSPNVQIYNTVIDALCKCRSASQALAVLKQMFANGCDPDVVTFNTLIAAFCREGFVQEAEQLLRKAIRMELKPNRNSYTPLIHGFCIRGEVMVASDLLVEMMEQGHTPDVVTFGALIHGLVVAGQVTEALIVRDKMIERQVMPDANKYNVLISGLCKKQMLPAAKNLLAEMLENNVQPDKYVYTTLIDGFIRSENLSDAKKIFEFMEQKGVCPDVVGYNAMIKGYCQFGMMNEAILCMSSMKKVGYIPDEYTYTTVIDGYTKQGNMSAALRLLCDMMKRRCKPNVVTYSSLISGYCKIGDTDTAEDLFENMRSEGLFPNVIHYTILIGSLFKKDKVRKAAAYFERMLLNHCSPNDVTSHYLVNGLTNSTTWIINSNYSSTVKFHDNNALLDVFKGLVSDGWDPRISAYNSIIFSLCRHNMLAKALDFKDKMANKGYSPDPITFLSLLYGFCSVGKPKNWGSILPNEFQKGELETIFKYKTLLDQHVVDSVSCEVSRVVQLYAEEFQYAQQPELRFTGS
ncbi:hypothetical protein EJB05_02155, partial [Eragrostis curvula]